MFCVIYSTLIQVEQLGAEAYPKALDIELKVFALFLWPYRSANFLVRRFLTSSRVDDSHWNCPFWCTAVVTVFVLWACLLSVCRSNGVCVNYEDDPTYLQPGYFPPRSGRDRLPPIAWVTMRTAVWIWHMWGRQDIASSMQKRLSVIVSAGEVFSEMS